MPIATTIIAGIKLFILFFTQLSLIKLDDQDYFVFFLNSLSKTSFKSSVSNFLAIIILFLSNSKLKSRQDDLVKLSNFKITEISSLDARYKGIKAGFSMFKDNPIIGVGLGGFNNQKYGNILTTNTRMFVLFITIFWANILYYFLFELIVLNSLLLYYTIKEEKISSYLLSFSKKTRGKD